MAKALTVKQVENITPKATRMEVPDGDVPGFYLVVQPSGAKSWALRYRHAGKPKKLTIGSYPAFPLKDARDLARAAVRAVAEGRDPSEAKQAAKRASGVPQTIDELAKIFIERYARKHTRADTWKETARILGFEIDPENPDELRRTKTGGYVLSRWSGRRIETIKRGEVIALLDDVADRHAVYANRVLAAVRKMFNWGVDRDLVAASPCAGVKAPSEEVSRDRVLMDQELRTVLLAADKLGKPFNAIVKVLALTLQRRDEVANMRWSEINLTEKVWTLPPERVKNGNAHIVPLSGAVMTILKSMPRRKDCDFVFTTTGRSGVSGFSKIKRRLDELMAVQTGEPVTPWRLHDLRRTGATDLQRLRVPLEVVEKILNHTSGSFAGIVGIYQRHSFLEEKRVALEAWAQFVEQLVAEEPAAEIVYSAPSRAEARISA